MRRLNAAKLHLLTVREVQTLKDGDHADGGGLYIRVRGASATFLFRFTSPGGKRREMGLGVVHRGNAAQAGQSITQGRELGAHARMQLQKGLDPIDERERLREEARSAAQRVTELRTRDESTLARVARSYHERVIEPTRTKKHAAQWISSLEQHVTPAIWGAPIATVTAPALLDMLIALRMKVPETAGRVRQRLEAVFDDAIFRGLCGTNPAAATRRKIQEARVRQDVTPLRALDYLDAPAVLHRIREAEGTAARCLEFAVLTAARTSEAITAEWNELDLAAGLWTVPASKMKAGEEHQVFLSARAVEIVRGQLGLDARFVFPSPHEKCEEKPISNMAMLTLLSRLGVRGETTVHGLCRATFSTWANETAAARPDVIEACLAHREADLVRKAYNRAKFTSERRSLLEAWANYLSMPMPAELQQILDRTTA